MGVGPTPVHPEAGPTNQTALRGANRIVLTMTSGEMRRRVGFVKARKGAGWQVSSGVNGLRWYDMSHWTESNRCVVVVWVGA
jgi:hypothetical protein